MSNPLTPAVKPDKQLTLRQQLASDYFKQQVAVALPKHMTPDRFIRVGLTALMKTPKLLDCTPESVLQCMLNCSTLGLEPDGRRAHLIPYGTTCTLIIDYKGIVELAKRSGDVSNIFSQIVCEKDVFSWENGVIKHQIDFRNQRGEMYAAYAIITFKDGTNQSDVMTKDEIDAIRKRSKASNAGPWVTDYNEMAKKTVFRRASKWITLSPEMADAFDKDDGAQLITGAPEIKIPSKPEHALDVESTRTDDDGDLGPKKGAEKPKETPKAETVPPPPGPTGAGEGKPDPGKVVNLEQPKPTEAPAQAPAPEGDPEQTKLIGMLRPKMEASQVTEVQLIEYCKKSKLCSRVATSLTDMVSAKLAIVVENFDRVIVPKIKGQ